MASVGNGFREVIVDEHFGGKWMDVDMNLGGGHGTFQGTKFCDRAGGFSYKAIPSPRQIMQNRFIYWRVLNDVLELTEMSMDYNLDDNQIRYIFRDSPIVSPISIQEDEELITIMVVTVTSVNRFTFNHPNKLFTEEGFNLKNKQHSIFHQVLNPPTMTLKSFNLFDHAINIPVPTTAATFKMPYKHGNIFALAYESGSVTVCKITKDDTIVTFDIRQANIFSRLLSYTPSLLRGTTTSPDASIGLQFFINKNERNKKSLHLATISINGHLRLYICNNLLNINEWSIVSDVLVDRRFALDGYTDCNLLLRINNEIKNETKFIIFIPTVGFHIFEMNNKLNLVEIDVIDFKESIMDYCITHEYLFILINNPDEETDWEIKSYNLNEISNPRFNLALLEPPPYSDVIVFPSSYEPKEFYFDLIFNKSSFSSNTIYNALSTFESSSLIVKYENDWEQTKQYAVAVIENEIRMNMNLTDEPLPDEEYYEIVLKYWLGFYNSCVEYHINTVKPLGLFYETNTQMICIVKKSRISFLRPTDFFETLYYFPHCVSMSSEIDDHSQIVILLKYFEIMDFIESTTDESHKNKINKRLIENRTRVRFACLDIANLLIEADPYSVVLESRHFTPMLSSKLKELGNDGDIAMRLILTLLSSWDTDFQSSWELSNIGINDDLDERNNITEFYMGSRFGANITYKILKQLLHHRFILLRNTMILQSLLTNYFAQHMEPDSVQMLPSLQDQKEAEETLIHCYGLLKILDKFGELVPDSLLERGLKVANILNINSVDHSIQGKLNEYWPMNLIEMFCNSTNGGLAIRSRVNQFRNTKIVAYADAAGKAIWPIDESLDHPFEEFLISSCQYTALKEYTTSITAGIPNGKSTLKKFYNGISDLFNGDYDLALGRFRSISNLEMQDDIYFSWKILGWQQENTLPPIVFFQKIINLFQIFGHTLSIQILANEALKNNIDLKWIKIMSVLGFKSALLISDYSSAYKFILQMPNDTGNVGKEKASSLRTFISQILERSDIEILINLDMDDIYYKLTTMKDEIKKILTIQGKLSNPMVEDGIYQMIYLYHLCQENYREAASSMLERVIQIGSKGKGINALKSQRDSYLDILSCLSLVEDPILAYASTRTEDTDFISLLSHLDERQEQQYSDEIIVPSEDSKEIKIKSQIRTLEDTIRELELCNCFILLEDKLSSDPIRFNDGMNRALEAVDYLTLDYRFDDAIKLARLWNISYIPIIRKFSTVCVNLNYDILPKDGDPSDYIRHLDFSELPNGGSSAIELAFLVLQNYIKKYEKPMETYIHQEVTLEFLSYSIHLPRWLVDSYKKRDVGQLINCYLRYGELEEGTNIAIDVIDATLGRRISNEFDPSINTVTAYLPDPVIPYTAIDSLAAELMAKPQYEQLFNILKQRCDDYVLRVNETRQERTAMFS